MSRIAGINSNTNSAMPGMPNVFCLFPEVTPSRFAIPIPRKKSAKSKLRKTKGNTSQFTYDGQGNLTRAQDAQSHAVQIGYNANGLPVSITDPLNHTVYSKAEMTQVEKCKNDKT